ncbi:MAG: L,D-transpeptidase [Cyanobacteria bacterium P01_D01_bin.36]
MRRQPPIVRCFVGLCFGCAISLIALEWRSPFPDPVVTPDSLRVVTDSIKLSTSTADASNAAEQSETTNRHFWPWSRASAQAKTAQTTETDSLPVRLVLSLEERHLDVVRPGKPTLRYDVAVGQEDWQTPTGSFTVMSKIETPAWQHPITKEEIPPGPDNPLGERWIGFWSNGEAQIGFHGTNQEDLIGEAVSHGCIRMRNKDIKKLYDLVQIGTSVEVTQ